MNFKTSEKLVVILLSDKRSGSTMIQNSLSGHPSINIVNYSPHTFYETHHWVKGSILLKKNKTVFSKNYWKKKKAKLELIDLLKGNLQNFEIPSSDKKLIFEGWEALCEKFSKPIFFEKTPHNLSNKEALSLLLEWIEKTKRNVKIIGLIRNPISVQYSAYKLFRSLPNKRQFSWLKQIKNLIAFENYLNEDQYLRIYYEKIVENPDNTFREICNFLGIEYKISMSENISGKSLNKWKYDENFFFIIDESVVQLATNIGYSKSDLKMDLSTKKINFFKKILWYLETFFIKRKNYLYYKIYVPIKLLMKI